jgi:SlyX protein
VYRQQQQIDLLQAQLRLLYTQMQTTAEPAEPRNLRDEIPPHY